MSARPTPPPGPHAALLHDLVSVPDLDVVVDPDIVEGFRRDRSPAAVPAGVPAAVVRPTSTSQVAAVLAACDRHEVPVVPRGGGTGLAGGANAITGCVVVSTEAMDQIVDIDPVERTITAQAGVLTAELRRAAAPHGLWYAPDPSSHEICTVGGNIATDAGGLCCVKYGTTRNAVVSLDVVLADGTVARLGSHTRKGVVGYDLAGLVVGSEGTLAVVTEATLRLLPLPPTPSTVVATFPTTEALAAGLDAVHRSPHTPSLFEVMDRATVAAVEDLLAAGLDRSAAGVVFVQVDTADRAAVGADLQARLVASGASECYTTDDPAEGELLLGARRAALVAVERRGPVLLDDLCVPVGQLAGVLVAIEDVARRHGVQIATFGHAGDGNLHPTIVLDDPERAWAAFDQLLALARSVGGTVAGEHGVGALKLDHARRELGSVVVGLHHATKAAWDPVGILNPGKAF